MRFANSSAGLEILADEAPVTVTREEHHQGVLARYRVAPGAERTVAVELGWCTITSGRYRGERAVEVRLDGERVGELTYLMSQRYGPLVSAVSAQGGRPGCAAVIESGARGLQVTLRLPTDPAAAAVPPAAGLAGPATPAGAVPPQRPGLFSRPATWVVVGVVAVLALAGIIDGTSDSSSPASGDTSVTTEQKTTEPTTTEPTTTVPTTPPTTTTTKPPPPPTTVKPPPVTRRTPIPVKPPPAPKCDPNYTGCVPVASDVDCAGGSGNGPAYANGPVQVVGTDIYDLDSDDDGTACE